MRTIRTLLIEESAGDAELLMREIRQSGCGVEFERVRTVTEFTAALDAATWDAVLSDIGAGSFRAIDALAILSKRGDDLPFIIVSGPIGEEAAVDALKAGAHDFLFKSDRSRLVPVLERELRVAVHRRRQREADEALRRSEAEYRSLVDRAAFGIYRATADGRFLSVNPALVSMLGYGAADELLQVGVASLYADGQAPDPSHQAASRPNGTYAIWTKKSGETIRVRLTGHLTEPRDTGRPQCEVIVENVTEQYALQEQLRLAQKMEALGQLAGGVAHDFNNLLTAILGYAEILTDQIGPGKPIGEDLRQIKAAAERATTLTRLLLGFSRKQVLAVKPLDLSDVIRPLDALLRRVIGAHFTVVTKLSDSLPKVMADHAQLTHLLITLVVNARDAMPDGGVITIETRAVDAAAALDASPDGLGAGCHAALSVADEGVGMSRGVQTGPGFSTVYATVKQLGGLIDVENELGKGCRFTVYLPAATHRAAEDPRAVDGVRGEQTILLVDDEPGVRTLARKVLERAGYRVIEADSAEAALARAEEHDGAIDLLLTDIVLPGLNGHELAVRLAMRRPQTRRLFISGYAAQLGPADSAFGPGVQILEKPFTGPALLARTREVLAVRFNARDRSA